MHTLRTTTWTILVVLLLAIALPLWGGCGSGTSAGAAPPIVDFAAVSENYPEDRVFVWLDALRNPASGRAPDVFMEFSQWTNSDNRVRFVRMAGDQLFVLTTRNSSNQGAVLIWNDFRNIVGNPPPDVILDSSSGMSHPNYIAVFGGDLYVSNRRGNNVLIFRDAAALGSYDPPDVVLSDDLYQPNCVLVSDHALYVSSPENNTVSIFHDPTMLVSGDEADVILGDAPEQEPVMTSTALLTGSQLAGPKHLFLNGNTLHVTCIDRGNGQADGVWGFSPANALVDYQAPDFILGGPGMDNDPMCVRQAGGRLWVSTRDWQTGLRAYSGSPVTGELPSIELMSDQFGGGDNKLEPWTPEQGTFTFVPGDVYEFVAIAGGLIGASDRNDAIFGYLDAASIQTDQVPDWVAWWPGMESIRSLDAVIR